MKTTINWKSPNYSEIYFDRNERYLRLSEPKYIAALRLYYKTRPVEFINDWVFTYDPRKKSPYMPFVLFPKQEEFIVWLYDKFKKKEDGLTEKSRDMGVTWLCVAFGVWAWIHHSGVTIGFGSRKASMVDRLGDPDSILEKARIIIDMLPRQLWPIGFDPRKHARHLKIKNPELKSIIKGEGGDQIGRGGRSTMYFKDESAFYMRPEKIEAALSQNSDVKVDVSTPNGVGNPFYKKRFGGEYPVFTFHWKADPRKDEAWYLEQCRKLDPLTVAQEIDINYETSIEKICIPAKWVRAAVGFKIADDGAGFAGLDPADETGPDSNALVIRKGVVVKHIETWNNLDTTQTTRRAFGVIDGFPFVEFFQYDSVGVGAGVRGEAKSIIAKRRALNQKAYKIVDVNTASAIPEGYLLSGKKNKDMFLNFRAFLWWSMRIRFQKTWETASGIAIHPADECMSIPDDPRIISEFSCLKYDYNDAGKIFMEKKADLRLRGIKSPNIADAIIVSFARPKSFNLSRLVTK